MPRDKPITWNGETLSFAEWGRRLGITRQAARDRYLRNGSFELLERRGNGIYLTFGEKTLSLWAWAKEVRLPASTIRSRYRRGLTAEEILRTAPGQQRNVLMLEHEGVRLSLAEWSLRTGVPLTTIYGRHHRGLGPAEILKKGRL